MTFLSLTHRDSTEKDTWLISLVLSSTHRDPICEKDSMNTKATALIPYYGQGPTTEALSIIKWVVSLTSENKYKSENVNLLLWIYDGNDSVKKLLLEECFRNKLSDAEVGDEGNTTRPAMRNICKYTLDAVNKASNNCPIILPSLTFNIFSHYLTTRRNKNKCYLEKTTYGSIKSALTHYSEWVVRKWKTIWWNKCPSLCLEYSAL